MHLEFDLSHVEGADLHNVAREAYRIILCTGGHRAAAIISAREYIALLDFGAGVTPDACEAQRRELGIAPYAAIPTDDGYCGYLFRDAAGVLLELASAAERGVRSRVSRKSTGEEVLLVPYSDVLRLEAIEAEWRTMPLQLAPPTEADLAWMRQAAASGALD